MRFKKLAVMISGLMSLLLITVGCNSEKAVGVSSADAEFTLRLATWHPSEADATKEYLTPFMEKVTDLTDGRVQFEYFPGEQLGKAADALSLVKSGVADISHFSPSFSPSEMTLSSTVPGIPGLYESTSKGAEAFYNVTKASVVMEKDYLNHGVRPISLALTPFYDVFNNKKPIQVPDDIQGLKIRTAGGIFSTIVNELGATPVQIPTADIYSAYSSGIIDGLHFSSSNMSTFSLDELVKFATPDLNLGAGINGLIINEQTFKDLPQDIQDILVQVGEEMGIKYTKFEEEKNIKEYDKLRDSSEIEVYTLTDSDKKQWEEFYLNFRENIVKDQSDKDLKDVLDLFLKELK